MTTSPEEFQKFHALLITNAPAGYVPWYFVLEKRQKDPCWWSNKKRASDVSNCCNAKWIQKKFNNKIKTVCEKCNTSITSWKAVHVRLNFEEACLALSKGFNIAIAARRNDKLVIVDVDNLTKIPVEALKKTLMIRSSKRLGVHAFYWGNEEKKVPNIPTESFGEVRSEDQYVVCAGSYVERSAEEIARIPEADKHNAGKYSVENAIAPASITLNELPKIYLDELLKIKETSTSNNAQTFMIQNNTRTKSKFFDLTIRDVCPKGWTQREAHPLHGSETGQNWLISEDGKLGTCWRHNCTLNAQQYLCVESGFMTCIDAGTPFGCGKSNYANNDAALFAAVKQAWKRGLCGKNDGVPGRVIKFIAQQKGWC